jgi:hypothetical protein
MHLGVEEIGERGGGGLRQVLELRPRFPIFGGWKSELLETIFTSPLSESAQGEGGGAPLLLTVSPHLIFAHVRDAVLCGGRNVLN